MRSAIKGSCSYQGTDSVGLSEIDRNLLDRCLQKKPRAWEDFVDRFMGLVLHVIRHTAQSRSIRLSPEDRDDLCAEVFLAVIRNDFAVLRNFRGQSSLATYLDRRGAAGRGPRVSWPAVPLARLAAARSTRRKRFPIRTWASRRQVIDREEVEQLLGGLQGTEALVVRMFHLEGKSYQEISTIGRHAREQHRPDSLPARDKLRRAGVNPAVS